MRIAIPVTGGLISPHFGRCEEFLLFDVENGEVKSRDSVVPPPHEPGAFPAWLREQGANVIVASGMGRRAQALFSQQGIEVALGASANSPDEIIASFLNGTLERGDNVCDHSRQCRE
jgi:predicted Fe-Mo cluster-binding NifX family protein